MTAERLAAVAAAISDPWDSHTIERIGDAVLRAAAASAPDMGPVK